MWPRRRVLILAVEERLVDCRHLAPSEERPGRLQESNLSAAEVLDNNAEQ